MDGSQSINIIRNTDLIELTFGNHTDYYDGDNYVGFYDFAFGSNKKM